MSAHGLLLFAHGARDPRWALPFEAVLAQVRQTRPELPTRLAFLEFMSPDLIVAGNELAAAGCTEVTVVPLFLGAGGHVRKDLPLLIAQLADEQPGTRWRLSPAVGEVEAVVAAMAAAALSAAQVPAAQVSAAPAASPGSASPPA